jgi:hypothetical protein
MSNTVKIVSRPGKIGFRFEFSNSWEASKRYLPRQAFEVEMVVLSLQTEYETNNVTSLFEIESVLEITFAKYLNNDYWYNCALEIVPDGITQANDIVKARSLLDDALRGDPSAIEPLCEIIAAEPEAFRSQIEGWVGARDESDIDNALPTIRFLLSKGLLEVKALTEILLRDAEYIPSKKFMQLAVDFSCNLNDAVAICSRLGWRKTIPTIVASGNARGWTFDFTRAVKIAENTRDNETLALLDSYGANRSTWIPKIDVNLGLSEAGWKDICDEYGSNSWKTSDELDQP